MLKPHLTNPHYQRYDNWRRVIAARLANKRGGAARLSRYLGVGRQSVHRWLHTGQPMPAWAAMATSIWWQRVHEDYPAVLFVPSTPHPAATTAS